MLLVYMCGIAGFVKKRNSQLDEVDPRKVLKHLLLSSESRGHDSAGIAVTREDEISVDKQSLPASKYLKSSTYREVTKNPKDIQAAIAHARMETNGSFYQSENNQPVVKDGLLTVHNGIIVNDEEVWKKNDNITREYQVDTEVFNSLVSYYEKVSGNIYDAINKALDEIKGSYSFATLFDQYNYLLLATNTGSLFYIHNEDYLVFASEKYFLKTLKKKYGETFSKLRINQLQPKKFFLIGIEDLKIYEGRIEHEDKKKRSINIVYDQNYVNNKVMKESSKGSKVLDIEKYVKKVYSSRLEKIDNLRRCTKCILPETMPFIEFDDEGVCNYCRNYKPIELKGKVKLEEHLKEYRRNDGEPDCILAFSGGRDSSYALHYIKEEMNMNPVAYSYDWGMITDLGRRNQARMTGELGVEHILISADIQKKRENIKKNVLAWLKRPSLGTVPLFMAGDKQYFYYASMLSKQMGIDLVVLSENLLEVTNFKTGFCGIKPKIIEGKKFYALSLQSMFKLLFFYGKEFLLNPSYINTSLLDSMGAFGSYYVMPHNLLSLYSFINWDENIVEETLTNKYDWETAEDTDTTWRIGDGTAAFYNYIYYIVAGFSEIDTFRSNQIREGVISREEALIKAKKENRPRVESLIWYTDTIDIDILNALKVINSIETLY